LENKILKKIIITRKREIGSAKLNYSPFYLQYFLSFILFLKLFSPLHLFFNHFFLLNDFLQRGSDELLSQTVMAPAADNNNQDLATKKAKLDSNTVIGGVGELNKKYKF
jgi:hypothetical protein